ncbi:MAG: VOC family protein, partial [Actinomycetota bacterium]
LGPGVAIRLWSKAEHGARAVSAPPAIVNADLADVVLDLARRGISDPSDVPFLTQPPPERWDTARELLRRLGAIDDEDGSGRVTADGVAMARLPVHPRLARMIVGARHPWLACLVAATLDDRDILRGRPADLPVDLTERIRLLVDPDAHHHNADGRAIRQTRERARTIARRAGIDPGISMAEAPLEQLGPTLAPGFPDRIARSVASIRGGYVTASGAKLTVDHRQPIGQAAGLVAIDIDPRSKRGAVHRAARLEARLDHLVYATPDLAATVATITDEWGIVPTAGGAHDGLGTRNALLALGAGAYLEVIGPDPQQPDPVGPRPFGVDDVDEPRLVTWAASVPHLDLWLEWCASRKVDVGPAHAMQRTKPGGEILRWRLTYPPTEGDGVIPFLIEWPAATPAADAAAGVELVDFTLRHPDGHAASRLREYALPHTVEPGPATLAATLFTPNGMVTLSS